MAKTIGEDDDLGDIEMTEDELILMMINPDKDREKMYEGLISRVEAKRGIPWRQALEEIQATLEILKGKGEEEDGKEK